MRNCLRVLGLLLFACAGLSHLKAQEATIMPVGDMSTSTFQRNSFAWQVEYRLYLTNYFALSEAYLNEGKVTGHRRDGYATEGWINLPFDARRISFALGAGFYNFFDTQPLPNGDSLDVHGTAPIVSLSATTYIYKRLYARFTINRIMPSHDIRVNTATAGLGLWLGKGTSPVPLRFSNPDADGTTKNELTVYYGQSTVNTFRNEKAAATSIEYRHGLAEYVDATVAWINEGDPQIVRRNGVAVQLWPVNTFAFGGQQAIGVGMGLGLYGYIDRKNVQRPGKFSSAALAFLVSPAVTWKFSKHWSFRIVLHRVVTNYNRDADIYLAGLSYRWGR
jgi:hypothetical protein